MRLAHPCKGGHIGDFHVFSPEFLQGFFCQPVQDLGAHAAAGIDNLVDFPLVGRFQQVSDEIVIISISYHA